MVFRAETLSGAEATNQEGFQRHLRNPDLNVLPGFDVIFISAVVIHKNSILLPHLYEYHCSSMEEVPKTLGDVSTHGFSMRGSQGMEAISKKGSSSKKKSERDKIEKEDDGTDYMKIVDVSFTDNADAMSAENHSAINECVCNVYEIPSGGFVCENRADKEPRYSAT